MLYSRGVEAEDGVVADDTQVVVLEMSSGLEQDLLQVLELLPDLQASGL